MDAYIEQPPAQKTSGVPKRRTQTERRSIAERSLIEAARRLVARRGVDRTSVADVGEEAGYSRGLVNHRFGSKAALLQTLARDSQQALEAVVTEAPDDTIDALLRLTDSYFRWVGQDSADARAFLVMWGAATPEESDLRALFVEFDERFRDRTAELLRQGQSDGSVAADLDCRGLAITYIAMLRGIGVQKFVSPDHVDLVASQHVVERWIRGLG